MFHVKHFGRQTIGGEGKGVITSLPLAMVFIACCVACFLVLSGCQKVPEMEPAFTACAIDEGVDVAFGYADELAAFGFIAHDEGVDDESFIEEDSEFGVSENTRRESDTSSKVNKRIEESKVADTQQKIDYTGMEYEEDTILVSPTDAASANEIAEALGVDGSAIAESDAGLLEVKLPAGMQVEEAIQTLRESGAVEDAQPNFIYHLQEDNDSSEDIEDIQDTPTTDEISPDKEAYSGDSPITFEEVEHASDELGEGGTSPAVQQEVQILDAPASSSGEPDASIDIDTPITSAPADSPDNQSDDSELRDDVQAEEDTTGNLEAESLTDPNDPGVSKQWALQSVNAFEAWNLLEKQVKGAAGKVTVALFDEGFEMDHPDLVDNFIEDGVGGYASYNSMDEDAGMDAISSLDGHGTHVAGIVAATADNNLGVAGISFNQKLLPIKVFDDNGNSTTSALVAAYRYTMQHQDVYNIHVVNLSVGLVGSNAEIAPDSLLGKAIDEAYAQGIVTVASAGNAKTGVTLPAGNYPSDYGTVVSVINLQEDNQSPDGVSRSGSSNYNRSSERSKNISAPGTSIYSTYLNAKYAKKSGTSMAAPCVAGVFAMVFAANPQLGAQDAVDVVYSTARDLGPAGFDAETGWGEVDAAAAVAKALETAPSDTGVDENPTPTPPADSTPGDSKPQPSTTEREDNPAVDEEPTASIPRPSYRVGATRMPVKSTSTWKLSHCILKVLSGKGVVSVAKNGTVTARKQGMAKLGIFDEAGKKVKSFKVRVYKLSGVYNLQSAKKASLYWDIRDYSHKSGAQLITWKLKDAKRQKNQQFKFTRAGSTYQMKAVHSGKILTIKGSSKEAGAWVVQRAKTDAKASKWKISVDAKNRLTFTNAKSGKVLAISGAAKRGAGIIQRAPMGTSAEKWRPQPAT